MARERMVTRTIIATVCNYRKYNEVTDSMETATITLTGTLTDRDIKRQIMKSLPETETFLKVLSTEPSEQLYAMTEEDFLKYAKPIERGATRVPEK